MRARAVFRLPRYSVRHRYSYCTEERIAEEWEANAAAGWWKRFSGLISARDGNRLREEQTVVIHGAYHFFSTITTPTVYI